MFQRRVGSRILATGLAILGGMALSAIRGGISLDLDVDNILSLVTTAGLLYVAYSAVDNARTALMN